MRVTSTSPACSSCGLTIVTLGLLLLVVGCPGNSDNNNNANNPPRAIDPVIVDNNGGAVIMGDVVTGNYDYFDSDGDAEGASTFRWLRNGVEIPGATAIDYTLTNADNGQSIAFEVTPVAASGVGSGTAVASYTVCADDGTAPGVAIDSYVFAVPKNLPDPTGSTRVYVDVSGAAGTRGTIAFGAVFSRSFLICDASERLELPASVMLEGNRAKESKAVSVITDADVALQVSSYHRESVDRHIVSADAYAALPDGTLGTRYTVNNISSSSGQPGFGIANAGAATASVSVMVSDAVGTLLAGQSDNLTLGVGETIQYLTAAGGDLTGSSITADQPLAVVSFHSLATVPDGVQAGSFLMEQLAPDASLGAEYYVAVPETRARSTVRIVGVAPTGTTVNTTPAQVIPVLDAGDSVDLVIDGTTIISADQPISVMQFSHGEQDDNVPSSAPFMLQVPSTDQFGASYRVVAPEANDNIAKVFATVVIPTSDVSAVKLNGVSVDPLTFTDIDGSYSVGTLGINTRDNLLEGTGMGVMLYGYGDTPADSSGSGIPNGIGMGLRE